MLFLMYPCMETSPRSVAAHGGQPCHEACSAAAAGHSLDSPMRGCSGSESSYVGLLGHTGQSSEPAAEVLFDVGDIVNVPVQLRTSARSTEHDLHVMVPARITSRHFSVGVSSRECYYDVSSSVGPVMVNARSASLVLPGPRREALCTAALLAEGLWCPVCGGRWPLPDADKAALMRPAACATFITHLCGCQLSLAVDRSSEHAGTVYTLTITAVQIHQDTYGLGRPPAARGAADERQNEALVVQARCTRQPSLRAALRRLPAQDAAAAILSGLPDSDQDDLSGDGLECARVARALELLYARPRLGGGCPRHEDSSTTWPGAFTCFLCGDACWARGALPSLGYWVGSVGCCGPSHRPWGGMLSTVAAMGVRFYALTTEAELLIEPTE